jgi:hypothetical protein
MKQNLIRQWLVATVLVGLQAALAPAQDAQKTTAPPSEPTTPPAVSSPAAKPAAVNAAQADPSEPGAKGTARPSAGLDEILKMLQAGVSKDVIKTYIETAPVVAPLSASDIVSLKERGLPDDVTMALMKRAAELTARTDQAGATNAAPAKVTGTASLDALVAALRRGQANTGHLDPEGYDYFRYYYLQPRSIAAANERLYSYPPFAAYPPYGPGYYSPWGLRPGFFGPQYPGGW